MCVSGADCILRPPTNGRGKAVRVFRRLGWVGAAAVIGSAASAQAAADAVDPCTVPRHLSISADSIGPLPFGVSAAALHRICASARIDTTVIQVSEHFPAPGVLVVAFPAATVWGTRRGARVLVAP